MDSLEGITVRSMEIEDYDAVAALWAGIHGLGIRAIDDSREGVGRFLQRNPTCSVVAQTSDGEIIGSILCGHDGRQACLYHVCVRRDWRKKGIGRAMVNHCVKALKKEKINRVYLIAFKNNQVGNIFWTKIGWAQREDRNYYDLYLTDENDTIFNA